MPVLQRSRVLKTAMGILPCAVLLVCAATLLQGQSGTPIRIDASAPFVEPGPAASLQRLRTDHIDVYRPARLDANVPIEKRRDRGRDRGARAGRATCATSAYWRSAPTRSGARPRCIRSSTSRSSTRWSLAGSSARSSPRAASSGSRSPRTGCSARADQRPLQRHRRHPGRRHPRADAALSGRQPPPQPRARRAAARDRRRQGRQHLPDRVRLGAVPRGGTSCRSSGRAGATS